MIIIKLLNHTVLFLSHTAYLKELSFSNRVLSETNNFPATGGRNKHKETNTSDQGFSFISSDSIFNPLTLVTSCEKKRAGGETERERGRERGERESERGGGKRERERGGERGGERVGRERGWRGERVGGGGRGGRKRDGERVECVCVGGGGGRGGDLENEI